MTRPGYAVAASTVGWLVTELETALEHVDPGASVDVAFMRAACGTRVPTADEMSVAVNGLVDLGVLRRTERGYTVDAETVSSTREYRRGFRAGLAAAVRAPVVADVTLCMAIPPGMPLAFNRRIADAATDLRAGLVNVVASATHRLVLASPFWDVATASDIGELARRRVEAGVTVDILGRSDATDDAMAHFNRLFSGLRGVRLFRWYEPDRAREAVTTFHFKAVVADEGARAYVGTANLTRSSLRSTMELGFIVEGKQGQAVARILDSVLAISERIGSTE